MNAIEIRQNFESGWIWVLKSSAEHDLAKSAGSYATEDAALMASKQVREIFRDLLPIFTVELA